MLMILEVTIIFLLGLAVGSFLNVIILRLVSGEQWTKGRSHCPDCKTCLTTLDLIPLASFLLLRGRCRYCNARISWQYPIVEFTAAVLFICAYFSVLATSEGTILLSVLLNGSLFPFLLLIRNIFFIGVLLILFVTDFRWFAIYDGVIVFGSAIAIASNILIPPFFSPQYIFPAGLNLLIAAGIPAAFFGIQYVISKGRWIGSGDIFLGIMMGLMIGYPQIVIALFIAYCSGALVGVFLLATGKRGRKSEIPFGTFLTAATMIMILYGDQIMAFVSQTFLL